MTGFIISGIAFLVLILFMKFKPSLSEEELNELKGISAENEKKDEKSRARVKRDNAANLLVQVIEDGTVDELKRMIKNGINILQKLENNQNLLMIAVKNNPSPEVVHFLLHEGVEVNDVDDNGQTALILAAAFNSNPEVITALLENGADKTIKDKQGKTASDYVALNSSFFGTDVPAMLKIY